MLYQRIILIISLASCLVFFSSTQNSFAFKCETLQGCSDIFLRPPIDTTHTFAIYCCGAESLFSLPFYWQTVWQMVPYSIPAFFDENSMGKYNFSCDPVANYPYAIQHPSLNPDSNACTGGGAAFATGIFEIVDDSMNFANYDGDGDGIVDGFFFVILGNHPNKGCACLTDFSYKTNDTTSTGDTVWVLGERGIEVRAKPGTERIDFVHICVHEWGHQLGLKDLHGT